MKKKQGEQIAASDDDLEIPELPAKFFKSAVRGKYYNRVMASSNVVRIAPELSKDFPNESTVNEALRLVQQIRQLGERPRRKKSA